MEYKEAEIFCRNELSKIKNLSSFSRQHNLCYATLIKIRRGKNSKKYPLLVQKLCSIFGKNFTIKIEKIYGTDV